MQHGNRAAKITNRKSKQIKKIRRIQQRREKKKPTKKGKRLFFHLSENIVVCFSICLYTAIRNGILRYDRTHSPTAPPSPPIFRAVHSDALFVSFRCIFFFFFSVLDSRTLSGATAFCCWINNQSDRYEIFRRLKRNNWTFVHSARRQNVCMSVCCTDLCVSVYVVMYKNVSNGLKFICVCVFRRVLFLFMMFRCCSHFVRSRVSFVILVPIPWNYRRKEINEVSQ